MLYWDNSRLFVRYAVFIQPGSLSAAGVKGNYIYLASFSGGYIGYAVSYRNKDSGESYTGHGSLDMGY